MNVKTKVRLFARFYYPTRLTSCISILLAEHIFDRNSYFWINYVSFKSILFPKQTFKYCIKINKLSRINLSPNSLSHIYIITCFTFCILSHKDINIGQGFSYGSSIGIVKCYWKGIKTFKWKVNKENRSISLQRTQVREYHLSQSFTICQFLSNKLHIVPRNVGILFLRKNTVCNHRRNSLLLLEN